MNDTLISYVRNEFCQPTGVIVGKLVNNEVVIGVSLCNTSADSFDKKKGRRIAEGRISAKRNSLSKENFEKISSDIQVFKTRCKRYFKKEDISFNVV